MNPHMPMTNNDCDIPVLLVATQAPLELQKAIAGQTTHDAELTIPVFPNTQHMPELVAQVDAWLDDGRPLHAYLINGHGIYTWGRDMAETRRHLEALEFLLGCALDLRRLSA